MDFHKLMFCHIAKLFQTLFISVIDLPWFVTYKKNILEILKSLKDYCIFDFTPSCLKDLYEDNTEKWFYHALLLAGPFQS